MSNVQVDSYNQVCATHVKSIGTGQAWTFTHRYLQIFDILELDYPDLHLERMHKKWEEIDCQNISEGMYTEKNFQATFQEGGGARFCQGGFVPPKWNPTYMKHYYTTSFILPPDSLLCILGIFFSTVGDKTNKMFKILADVQHAINAVVSEWWLPYQTKEREIELWWGRWAQFFQMCAVPFPGKKVYEFNCNTTCTSKINM